MMFDVAVTDVLSCDLKCFISLFSVEVIDYLMLHVIDI